MADSSPLSSFKQLSPKVWYYEPQESKPTNTEPAATPASKPTSLDLIILAAWMGATSRPIAKYIAGYQALYPNTPILLIRNEAQDMTFSSNEFLMKQLEPAISIVEKASKSPSSRIHLQTMSNGGGVMSRNLAMAYRKRHSTPLPITSMILDSCPGIEGFDTAVAAYNVGLPKFWPIRFVMGGLLRLLLVYFFARRFFFGIEGFITLLRRDLNDATLFPKDAPRFYIFSNKDELVLYTDVEKHIADAKAKGWKVQSDLFENSKHVAHAMFDSERYWKDVKAVAQ